MANALFKLSGKSLYLVSELLRYTCKYQIDGIEHFEFVANSGKPFILTGWHGMTMMTVPWVKNYHSMDRYLVIMPDDWRGISLEVFVSEVGAIPFPMNLHGDSSLSAGRKIARLLRGMNSGKCAFITPDGPEGPSFMIKPGLIYIAKKTGAYILPGGGYARHGYVVPRWDRYTIPYPFSRVSLCFGEPIMIDPEEKDIEIINQNLVNVFHRVTAQAAANFYEKKPIRKGVFYG